MSLNDAQLELTYKRLLNFATALLTIGALFYLGSYFYNIVALFGVALVITYILIGPVSLFEKGIMALVRTFKKTPSWQDPNLLTRAFSVTVVYILFFALMTLASVKLFPIIGTQVQAFSNELPGYVTQSEKVLLEWSEKTLGPNFGEYLFQESLPVEVESIHISGTISDLQNDSTAILASPSSFPVDAVENHKVLSESFLENSTGQLVQIIEQSIANALNNATTLITGTMNGLLYTIAGFLLVFYFLMDGPQLRYRFIQVVPKSARPTLNKLMDSFHQVMFTFIKGQVLLGILTGTYMFIIYSIFGVSFSFFLGAFFAISEILPVIGTWIGITPGIMVLLFTNPMLIIPVWLCSYGFQTIKDNIIAPKVVGDVMGLHPVAVIFSLIICAKAAGLVGILLALPLASILNIMIHYYREKHDDGSDSLSAISGGTL